MVSNFSKKIKEEFFSKQSLLKIGGVFLAILIFSLLIADIRFYQKKSGLKKQISYYENQIENIRNNNQSLKEEIANSDNPDYLEKIAYEQLGQHKPGEREVIFVSELENNTEQSTNNGGSWFGWLSNAWQWIKNRF